jgi:hypothetical protein
MARFYRWINNRRKTSFGKKKGILNFNPEIPGQEKLINVDAELVKKMQKKLAKAMCYLSDAAIDATYISRFDKTEPGWITKETKEIQRLSSKLNNQFRSKAPMEIWDEDSNKTTLQISKKTTRSWEKK